MVLGIKMATSIATEKAAAYYFPKGMVPPFVQGEGGGGGSKGTWGGGLEGGGGSCGGGGM